MKRALLSLVVLVPVALAPGCAERASDADEASTSSPLPDAPDPRDVVDAALAAGPKPPAPEPLPAEKRADVLGLLEFVAGASGDMRRVGAQDLWRLGDGAALALADIACSAERSAQLRSAALEVLGAGEPALVEPRLLDVLANAELPWVRGSAAWHLGEGQGEGWICDAILRLKYETDESVVVYIAQALGKHDVLAGLSGLRVISRSSWSEQQRTAAEAVIAELSAGTSGIDGRPQGRSPRFDAAVWGWIGRLAEFQLRGVDDARFILTNLGADAVPHLAAALSDDDRYIRLHACQCLERMGPKGRAAVDALLAQLGSPDLGPQAAVTLGAVSRGEPVEEVRAALVELMGNESAPPGLRLGATRGLARMGDPRTADALLAQFVEERTRWPELAQALAEALLATEAVGTRAGDGSERDERIDAALRFAIACLDTPGLDPASTGAAWEASAFVDGDRGPLDAFEDRQRLAGLPEDWHAIGAKRGPEFDAAAMWRERQELLERALGPLMR